MHLTKRFQANQSQGTTYPHIRKLWNELAKICEHHSFQQATYPREHFGSIRMFGDLLKHIGWLYVNQLEITSLL